MAFDAFFFLIAVDALSHANMNVPLFHLPQTVEIITCFLPLWR